MEYISIYGPPKIILSDQSCEFNKNLVEKLIKVVGVEHKVTAAYNPCCNGMVERLNQRIIETLRKHAEKDQATWNSGYHLY